MPDRTVRVAPLEARPSEYVSYARAGETVVVTDRDAPVPLQTWCVASPRQGLTRRR
jgi:hypothetical protein